MKPNYQASRRSFLKHIGAAGLVAPFVTRGLLANPPSEKVRHANFGASGIAVNDLNSLSGHPNFQLMCVAEVDSRRLEFLQKKFPGTKVYEDWRRLLDKEHKNLDTIAVSTPDHMHAPMAMAAMQLGIHVYVQKPLAHEIGEVRALTQYARSKKLVTQMGIQVHSAVQYRRAVQAVHSGLIGKIKEVHAWSNKRWNDPTPRVHRTDPIPDGFNWDLWLGVCSDRPYIEGYYHPGQWRKRLDFGTGTFGDMGCHIYDPVYEALGLTAPITVRSEGPTPNDYNWADNAIVRYVYPGTKYTAGKTVNVTWYDGDARPPQEVLAALGDKPAPGQGSIFIGEKGNMLLPHISGPTLLFPEADFKDYVWPKLPSVSHHWQFLDAVRGTAKTTTPFDYAGPLTESVLLGGVATRFRNTTLEWDDKNLRFKNVPEANKLLRRSYRKGWEVAGL